ncbi:MAG: hypothetical protein H6577_24945 [Lewinellaceae bacterium]|nr:hypothetical protein [Saprospiraceae bacterium]MCB9341385.1 hypothetical protein [Lewinellaceae bacterium]
MLGETYPIKPSPNKLYYLFTSEGPRGRILKIVLFQNIGENSYNLAFGDFIAGQLDDEVVSDNRDFVKVLSTVAACAYDFVKANPGVKLEIDPVDERRKMLYNAVFKRHHIFIQQQFRILGVIADVPEPYSAEKMYDLFELYHII